MTLNFTFCFSSNIFNVDIAGITNPKQLKADYDHLRYIIQNDHCYTPYTYADGEGKSDGVSDGAKCDVKSKLKLTTTTATTALQNATAKKTGRNAQLSKSAQSNGLDREMSNASNRSVDDVNSSVENTADRSSEEEEEEGETDYSDTSPSESDNDRDSDLDFSVNDCHSRRAKKIKKRKIQAKRMASKKRRRSTIDHTGSDDGSTPVRKKTAKLPKKSLNNSAKSSSSVATPTVSSTVKTPAATSTPRIQKIVYVKESPQSTSHDNSIGNSSIQKATGNPSTPSAATPNENKPKSIIILKQKEKKTNNTDNALLNEMSSLFTPDVIKKTPTDNTNAAKNHHVSTMSTAKIELTKPTTAAAAATTAVAVPVTVHGLVQQNTPKVNVSGTKFMKTQTVTFRKIPRPVTMNLTSETDKNLDLIDSLVQEELSKPELPTPTSSTSSQQTVIPAAIPNIVKMLETSEQLTSIGASVLTQQSINTSNTSMPMTYTTTQSVTDAQMLPDDLLESFVNSDYLSDDLMQHVAKLVEDKNLQEVIDQQLVCNNVASISSCTLPAPQMQTVSASPKPHIVQQSPLTQTKPIDEPKTPMMNTAKPPVTILNSMQTPGKEPIKVKRSDGRIITLPPIEAPTTRGAKRRAETTPTSDSQQKQKIITVILQTESPNLQKTLMSSPAVTTTIATAAATTTTPVKSSPVPLPMAKPIAVRERRASVAVKRASIDSKPKRSMSISNPTPAVAAAVADADFDDDEEDGSDGTANSEDDPHR